MKNKIMDIACKQCGKKLGNFSEHGKEAMKSRAKSYGIYHFCKEGDCLDKYMELQSGEDKE